MGASGFLIKKLPSARWHTPPAPGHYPISLPSITTTIPVTYCYHHATTTKQTYQRGYHRWLSPILWWLPPYQRGYHHQVKPYISERGVVTSPHQITANEMCIDRRYIAIHCDTLRQNAKKQEEALSPSMYGSLQKRIFVCPSVAQMSLSVAADQRVTISWLSVGTAALHACSTV